eukprot:140283_1
MLLAYGALDSREKIAAKISLCGLAGCAGYAIYRVVKSRKYQQNREDDGLPTDEEKMHEISKTINHIIFIDNLNVIRTELISRMLLRGLSFSVYEVKNLANVNTMEDALRLPHKIWSTFLEDYGFSTGFQAFCLDTAFNVYLRFKTKGNNMPLS